MRYQSYIVEQTKAAMGEAFRYLKAVPTDKVEWKPLEEGRSALSLAQELARTPVWAMDTIQKEEWDEEAGKKEREIMAGFKTIDDCEQECNRQMEKLFELYESISDSKLNDTKWLPFDGGREFTVMEMMDYPRWNANYHLGQIGYIQLLYGDKEMH